MATWKKVIVSGSDAELNHLKLSEGKTIVSASVDVASPLQFDTVSGSTSTTPLVIDSNGNIFTGSKYALKSGGDTVGGSGLSSSVAIVGAQTQTTVDNGDGTFTTTFTNTSLIQTASSTVPLDLNQADIINADDITSIGTGSFASVSSSTGYTIHTSSLATVSGDNLTIGSHTSDLLLTGSSITLEASGGITASVVPEIIKPTFYLGVGDDGEIQKIAESNVQSSGGGSGVTGITTCSLNDNINLSVTTTAGTESEESIGAPFYIGNDSNRVYLNNSAGNLDINTLLPSGTKVRLKGMDYALNQLISVDFIVDAFVEASGEVTIGNEQVSFVTNGSFTVTTTYEPDSDGSLIRAQLYKVTENVGTGVVEICLDPNLSVNDITQSGDLMFSASAAHSASEVPTQHHIYAASGSELFITASGISSSRVDVENLFIDGFSFASATATVTSASTVFGEDLTDIHRFTGSIEFGGDLTYVGSGSTTTETTLYAPFFSGSGANLNNIAMSNTDIETLSGSNGILISTTGDPTTQLGYNGTTAVNATINLSGSSLEVVSAGLGIKDSGVTTTKIANDAVTTAKLATVNSNVGTFGSSTAIPVIIVNAEGQITGITTTGVSTGFTISDGTTTDIVAGGETLTFSGTGITIEVTDNTVTFTQDKDALSLTGTTTIYDLDVTTNLDVTQNLTVGGTTNLNGNTTIGDASGDSHTINGDADFNNNVNIDGNLTVDGAVTLGTNTTDDITINGNLTVLGDTTTLSTSNLHVEDRFIVIGSGSATTTADYDAGIIFESASAAGFAGASGQALYYNASDNRLSVAKNISNAIGATQVGTGGTPASGYEAGNIVTVRTLNTTDGTELITTFGENATELKFGSGEMVIDKDNDIWIYTGAVDES